ncbi:Predicted branched-chain amino acid permease (azaleucine resistance) [Arthrobacter alpinus]|uniref:Predicted branched-chain amino acid permease (Azaleucine resistance) n=1 Tax=Arthrobacter alpinus TaxID=656366 RepID=A0A1H5N5M9_9MICC|nr:AzlC family ABC transporter permease [Arthrobacter alpinus]SEE96770.1 Predicted branched-chain amino acid permease (azaleucine resistance) [Arthrobacter alpinus]
MKLKDSPAAKIGASIAIATGLYGVSFGALSVAAGLSFWQTMVLSLMLFSGGSQFAFIGVVAAGGTGVAAMSASALLGIRNGVYGMQLNALLRPTGWRRFVAAHVTIDESTATATGQSDADEQERGFWVAGVGIFLLWNIMTGVGALIGDAMGDPKQWGLDGAAVAAFLGLLWPRIKAFQPAAIAVVCAVVTLLVVPFVPPGIPILVAALVAGLIGWFRADAAPDHAPGHITDGLEPDIEPYPHAGQPPPHKPSTHRHDAGNHRGKQS